MTRSDFEYLARVFLPNGEEQSNFRLGFNPVVRKHSIDNKTSTVVDVQVGCSGSLIPFVISGTTNHFVITSSSLGFFFRKMDIDVTKGPLYEVCLGSKWAWLNRNGSQGFAQVLEARRELLSKM